MVKGKVREAKTTPKVAKKVKESIIDADAPPDAKRARKNAPFLLSIPSLPRKSGNVLACGQNDVGQLGQHCDDLGERTRPGPVEDVKNVVDVKAGGMHSLCLTRSGEIWSFGCNDEGALGRDTSEEGSEMTPGKVTLPKKAVRISCGDSHSACLLEDGSIYAWGSFRDAHGSMGLTLEGKKQSPVRVLPEVFGVDIASGSDHFVVLTKNGHVYTIGCGEQGQLGRTPMRTLTGESRSGKTTLLTPGVISKRAKNMIANAIWATPYCTFLREAKTGDIYGFGLNNYNQICVQKGKHEFENFPRSTTIKDAKEIAGGQHHTIVLTNDHKVYSIGRKEYGRLGLGDGVSDDTTELKLVTELSDKKIVAISCGAENTFALSQDGKVYVFGSGVSSTLGTGNEDDVPVPKVLVSKQLKDANILAVSGGGQHSLFLVEVPSTESEEKESIKPVTVAKEAPKENGNASEAEVKTAEEEASAPVPMDTTEPVNGNSNKTETESNTDEKGAPKRGRKRKA